MIVSMMQIATLISMAKVCQWYWKWLPSPFCLCDLALHTEFTHWTWTTPTDLELSYNTRLFILLVLPSLQFKCGAEVWEPIGEVNILQRCLINLSKKAPRHWNLKRSQFTKLHTYIEKSNLLLKLCNKCRKKKENQDQLNFFFYKCVYHCFFWGVGTQGCLVSLTYLPDTDDL